MDFPLSDETKRLTVAQLDLQEARDAAYQAGQCTDALQAEVNLAQVQSTLLHQVWIDSMAVEFGVETAHKLANHQIERGMSLSHLVHSFGLPDYHEVVGSRWLLIYGARGRGSYFELEHGLVTLVEIVRPSYPAWVRDYSPA